MVKSISAMSGLVVAAALAGCAAPGAMNESSRSLVGAWDVTVSRPAGVGKNLLTFYSDGTFFRSGDTHPVLSGGHGAWKRNGSGEYEGTYVAFRFDPAGKWIGSTRTSVRITPGPGGNEFTGVGHVSNRDLQDKEVSSSDVRLQGKRIVPDAS